MTDQPCGVFGRAIPACPSRVHLPLPRPFSSRSRPQMHQRSPGRRRIRHLHREAASSDALSGFPAEPELPAEPETPVFSRIRERDPYRRLGVTREASFEEVQDARNFLYESYRHHERSREAIELAFDSILKEKIKVRNKFGFRPPRTGRKTDAAAEEKISWQQRFLDLLEPSVPGTTIVNEGVIYLLLGLWAAFQSLATDPSLPMASALGYAIYRLFTKRRNRSPDGPFFGGNAIWGAVATTVAAFAFAIVLSSTLLKYVPLPPQLDPQAFGLFLICVIVGAIGMFFK